MCHLSAIDPLDENIVGLRHRFAAESRVSSNVLTGIRSAGTKVMTTLASVKSYLAKANWSVIW